MARLFRSLMVLMSTAAVMTSSLDASAKPAATTASPKFPIVTEVEGQQREMGYITLKDGNKLSYIAYYPKKAGKIPVLVEYTPYGGGGFDLIRAQESLSHGYAYLGVDLRGTTCSTGEMPFFQGQQIADDGVQVIEFAGTRKWSNGAVGMIGNSYPGHNSIYVASRNPKYLKAIAPSALSSDLYSEVWRPGGMFAIGLASFWGYGGQSQLATGEMAPFGVIQYAGVPSVANRAKWGDTVCDTTDANAKFEIAFDNVKNHPLRDEWWEPLHLANYVGTIEVPTIIFGGWQDTETQSSGAVHLFKHLKARHKQLVMQPGGHGTGGREQSRIELFRWLDHFVKGVDNGVDREDPVKVHWEPLLAKDPSAGLYGKHQSFKPSWTTTHRSWPPTDTHRQTLYFTPDHGLSPAKPGATANDGGRTYTSVIGTELFGDNTQFALEPKASGVLTYRTPALDRDLALLGFTQLQLFFSSSEKNTDLMFVLHDIDPKGNVTFIQRDYLRAALREIDPARSDTEELRRSFRVYEELEPGKVYEAKLSIPPVGHLVRKGHYLEIAVMSPPQIGTPDWGFVLKDEGARNTIYASDKYPSNITLTLTDPPAAVPPAPECGEIDQQPCRKPPSSHYLR